MQLNHTQNFSIILMISTLCVNSIVIAKTKIARTIPEQGKFTITEKVGADVIKVTFSTKAINLPKFRPAPAEGDRDNDCTYSRNPCSLLINMKIIVNNKPIFVSRGSYSSLTDLNNAKVTREGKKYTLSIYSGEQTEAKLTKLTFDEKSVLAREVYSTVEPITLIERTQTFDIELEKD